jgi:phosphate transport system protein
VADVAVKRLGPQLVDLDREVCRLFDDIAKGARLATSALISGDGSQMKRLSRQDRRAGTLQRDVERAIEEQFARYAPMGSDFRYLVTVLRVVPELQRSADLIDHIAERTYLSAHLSPQVVDTLADMGQLAADMWELAGDAWATVDPDAAARLDAKDDRVDSLTAALPGLLAGGGVPPRTAIELALVGRFYERLGDHAVHIASRIRWLAKGS